VNSLSVECRAKAEVRRRRSAAPPASRPIGHLQERVVEIGDELDSWHIQLGQLLVAGQKQIDAADAAQQVD